MCFRSIFGMELDCYVVAEAEKAEEATQTVTFAESDELTSCN